MPFYEIKCYLTGKSLYSLPYEDLKNKDLRGKKLVFADFRNMDLRGSDLSNCDLTRADFTGANLTGCNLTGCKVLGCNFDGAIMVAVKGLEKLAEDFEKSSGFYRASWKNCDFYGVTFEWLDVSRIGKIPEFFEGCKNLEIPKKNIGATMFGV